MTYKRLSDRKIYLVVRNNEHFVFSDRTKTAKFIGIQPKTLAKHLKSDGKTNYKGTIIHELHLNER